MIITRIMLLLTTVFVFSSCQEHKIVYIASHTVDCEGVAPQKCMLYRENPKEEWTYFYDTIEGFEYEEGYQYQLEVAVTTITDPPEDASSLAYQLIKVISKEKDVALGQHLPSKTSAQTPAVDEVSYQELSRGYFMQINVNPDKVALIREQNQDPATVACSKKDWSTITDLVSNIDVKAIHGLEAPTQKRQFDGAKHAQLRIKTSDSTFTSCTFDAGAPPEEIKPLVDQIMSLRETVEKQ